MQKSANFHQAPSGPKPNSAPYPLREGMGWGVAGSGIPLTPTLRTRGREKERCRTRSPPLDPVRRARHFTTVKYANLTLLILFPLAWFAPLLRAALLPWFGMDEISVVSGLQSLWGTDPGLALLVTFLAIFAPYAKTIGLALIHFNLASPRLLPALEITGKLAMADIFLIALYIVLAKGVGHATIETAWGLYLFTGCILASLVISGLTDRADPAQPQGLPPAAV